MGTDLFKFIYLPPLSAQRISLALLRGAPCAMAAGGHCANRPLRSRLTQFGFKGQDRAHCCYLSKEIYMMIDNDECR